MATQTISLLTAARRAKGLSLLTVARAVDVTEGHLSGVERGQKQASPDLANKLSKYFKGAVTRDQILFPGDYQPKTRTTRQREAVAR